jgi:hypothetical protein
MKPRQKYGKYQEEWELLSGETALNTQACWDAAAGEIPRFVRNDKTRR